MSNERFRDHRVIVIGPHPDLRRFRRHLETSHIYWQLIHNWFILLLRCTCISVSRSSCCLRCYRNRNESAYKIKGSDVRDRHSNLWDEKCSIKTRLYVESICERCVWSQINMPRWTHNIILNELIFYSFMYRGSMTVTLRTMQNCKRML